MSSTTMRYFIDTEFIESGPKKPIQLVSIGIVGEDGSHYYAVSNEFNPNDANDWVKENVLSKLIDYKERKSIFKIRDEINHYIKITSEPLKPEFWGYYADYDWVVFCQIFGSMLDLPQGYSMYCRDIKQLCDSLGNPQLPEQGKSKEHNALEDAMWNKMAWEFLVTISNRLRLSTCQLLI